MAPDSSRFVPQTGKMGEKQMKNPFQELADKLLADLRNQARWDAALRLAIEERTGTEPRGSVSVLVLDSYDLADLERAEEIMQQCWRDE